MALTAGARIGPYEIRSAIGAGGMGEVYRARDTKLNRDVAIKVLPDLFAADPERLARFEREAQVLASLNHPHIAHIHGLEEAAGVRALVMELVEGEDLAQRIARGAMPIDEALPIARQIAEALEAAHERGVVHRDLKPANVKVTSDGTVKVLDFGLAKALDPMGQGSAADPAHSPTLTSPATALGVILGTAAYMAPEQARGKMVDKRADVWAFGCLVFEMLSGRRTFEGDSMTDTLAAIARDEPDWSALPPAVPASVRAVLARCLQKDPKQRLRDIGEARIALADPAFARTDPSALRRGSVWRTVGVPLAVVVAAAGATWLVMAARTQDPATSSQGATRRALLQVTGLGDIRSSSAALIALSADGSMLAYGTTVRSTSGNLHARRLDTLDSQPIEGTGGAVAAFLSHDGRLVGFEREGVIYTVPVAGGTVTRVKGSAHLGEASRPAWTPDGRIVYTGLNGELILVRADGSSPETLTRPGRDERHRSPHVLPDGGTVLFTIVTVGSDVNDARIGAVSLSDRRVRTLVADGAMTPQYADGFLLYVRPDRALMAVAFDPGRVELSGEPIALPDRVQRTRFGVAHFAAGRGVLVYVPTFRTRLVEVDRSGRSELLVAEERAWHHPRYSPDGTRIAVDVTAATGTDRDVWIYDRDAKTLSRVTRVGDAHDPSWLPSGREVSFFSFKSPGGPLLTTSADGGGEPRAVRIAGGFPSSDFVNPGAWMPDGSAYVGGVRDRGAPGDIWRIPRDGREPVKLVGSGADELAVGVSSDGGWLTYQSDETGRMEVYVRSLDAREGARVQVSNAGGTEPVWDPRGAVVYYIEADGARRRLMTATLRTSPRLAVVGRANIVPDLRIDESDNHANYDVHPNGSRVVMPELETSAGLVAVFDWASALRHRADASRPRAAARP